MMTPAHHGKFSWSNYHQSFPSLGSCVGSGSSLAWTPHLKLYSKATGLGTDGVG